MKDKYDEAIEYLTKNPDEINDAWNYASTHKAGCLFMACSPHISNGEIITLFPRREDRELCGCLTMVRKEGGSYHAWTDDLTASIRADDRIPQNSEEITLESLPVFAEWQRRLDKELNRV